MLTKDEFEEAVNLICPNCRSGMPLRFRQDSGEWIHDVSVGTRTTQTICWANGLRNSRFADGNT